MYRYQEFLHAFTCASPTRSPVQGICIHIHQHQYARVMPGTIGLKTQLRSDRRAYQEASQGAVQHVIRVRPAHQSRRRSWCPQHVIRVRPAQQVVDAGGALISCAGIGSALGAVLQAASTDVRIDRPIMPYSHELTAPERGNATCPQLSATCALSLLPMPCYTFVQVPAALPFCASLPSGQGKHAFSTFFT